MNRAVSKKVIGFSICFLLTAKLFGQVESRVAIIAKAHPDKILLRWAPTTATAWELANKYGYTLERYIVLRDSTILSPPERQELGQFKPVILNDWEIEIDKSDNAAIAAQAIYGETFEVAENFSTDIMQVVNKSTELNQRFSFALFAADQSYVTAQMSGIAFIDESVKPNEKYLYRVFANIPKELLSVDTGRVYLAPFEIAPLPPPTEVAIVISNRVATVQWNKGLYDRVYNTFIIERSENKQSSFRKISDQRIVNSIGANEASTSLAYKTDSIEYNKEYFYRVRGVDAFGEIGPPSEVVSGISYEEITYQINFTSIDILPNNYINFTWDFPVEMENNINGFSILKSEKSDGNYNSINADIVPSADRWFIDENPSGTAYYKIAFVSNNGSQQSFPHLVQLEDSIPPAIPTNIIGLVDTLGIVNLTWKQNEESDLLGYRVYRSNFKNSEFSEITVSPITINQFQDSINLRNLTKNVFYKVSAVDKRYNTSEFSEAKQIIKPDLIPPSAPVFKDYKIAGDTLQLFWEKSTSYDVSEYLIYKRAYDEQEWRLVEKVSEVRSACNLVFENIGKLEIALLAKDCSGKLSQHSIIFIDMNESDFTEFSIKFESKILSSDKVILLSWDHKEQGGFQGYKLYKSINGEALSLYRTIGKDNNTIQDSFDTQTEEILYSLVPILNNGYMGQFYSKRIIIKK